MLDYNILNCDCNVFLNSVKNESVQLCVTSPPYCIGKEYEKKTSLSCYLNSQKETISLCVNKIKPGGSICWQVGNHINNGEIFPLDILLYTFFKDCGLSLRNRIVWCFGHGLHCSKRFSGRHETILWFTKNRLDGSYFFNLDPVRVPQKYPNKRYFKGPKKGELSCNPLGKSPGDVWEIPNVKHNHPEKTEHPCQFPLELVNRLVLSLTSENDTVIDPYSGSGTTCVSALLNNRKFVGSEIECKYIEIAQKRINELRIDKT